MLNFTYHTFSTVILNVNVNSMINQHLLYCILANKQQNSAYTDKETFAFVGNRVQYILKLIINNTRYKYKKGTAERFSFFNCMFLAAESTPRPLPLLIYKQMYSI